MGSPCRSLSAIRRWYLASRSGLDHGLQALEGQNLHDVAGRLGLEDGFFPGKRVDSLAGLGGSLSDDLDLHQPRHRKDAWAAFAEVFLDEAG